MLGWMWNLAYVLHNPRCNGAALRALRSLSASQWWSRSELDAHQSARLDRLLDRAKRFAPYYSRILPDAIPGGSCRERLSGLPILAKNDIRANGPDLLSRDPHLGRLVMSQTGGSTGEPLKVARTLAARQESVGALLRGMSWAGIRPGDRHASLKAHGRISLPGRIRYSLLHGQVFGSALSKEHLQRVVVPALKALRPKYVTGYPTSLLALADCLEPGELRVPVLFSTGEMLYPHQRARLENLLGARVFDYNGSNEVEGIAFECEQGRRHVTDEQVVVEVVDDEGNPVWEETGRILVTDLRNDGMPFIRYELGDRGAISREVCPCGRNLLVLKGLEGRTQDAIRGPNGVALSGVIFAGRFRFLKRLRAYQVVQTSATGVELRYVPSHDDPEPEVREIAEWIQERLGKEMRVETKRCRELPLTRSGKTRLVVGLGTTGSSGAEQETPASAAGEESAP